MPSERYVIEAGGEAAGLLVSEQPGFSFHASAQWAWPLDGARYDDLTEAQRAVTDLYGDHHAGKNAA